MLTMSKYLGVMRRIVLSTLLASSLATAAFAFNATVYAKQDSCCLLITSCNGSGCRDNDDCFEGITEGGFCCGYCD